MKDVNVMLKLLLFLTFPAHLPSTDTHTLQYLYTAVSSGLKFTAVGLVDGEQFVFYDINMMRISEWMKKAEADDPDYWQREMERVKDQRDSLQNIVTTVMKSFNQPEGDHKLQRIYGCERDDDGTTRGYDQYSYDGEDFISLNLKTGNWTAADDKAEIFRNEWDPTGDKAKHWKDFLQTDCIDQLQKILNYGNKTLERKDGISDGISDGRSDGRTGGGSGGGSDGGSGGGSGGAPIGIIVGVVAALVVIVADAGILV